MVKTETFDRDAAPAAPARQRIAKLMARVGLCSRRDAEAWIVEGRVSLNGATLTTPATDVGPTDVVLVDGVPLPAAEKTRLFLFHKPRGLVTSDHDPEGRATVADHLRDHWPDGPRVVTIGRLDINTEGLLLLTNDGGLARLLELPKTGWARRYRVRAKGETDQGVLDRLRDGISIDGVDYAGIEATLDRTQGANVWMTMSLREGKNREIKRVLEHLGLEVNRLIRLSFGPFQLADLAEGAVEEVRTRVLRDQLGPALAVAAGVDFGEAAPVVEPAPQRRPADGRRADGGPRKPPRPARERDTRADRGLAPPRRTPREDAPAPVRERPLTGTRKHVSALRAAEAETARRGPRRRIERTDTKDRKDRTIAVERLVGARPARIEPTRTRGPTHKDRGDGDGRDARAPRQASPSALAKRARMARSGAEPQMDPRTRHTRDHDGERPDRRAGGTGPRRRPDERAHAGPPGRAARPGRRPLDDRDRLETNGSRPSRPPGGRSRERFGDKPMPRGRRPDGQTEGDRRDAPRTPRGGRPQRAERAGGGERRVAERASSGPKRAERSQRAERPASGDRRPRSDRPAPASAQKRGPWRPTGGPSGDKRPPRGPSRNSRGKPAPRPKR